MRYLDVTLSRDNNITTGKIYKQVIEREVSALTAFVLARFNSFSSSTTAKGRISGQDGSGLSTFISRICLADRLDDLTKIVPHLTNAIQDWIERVAKIPVDDTGEEPDVCIVEVRLATILTGDAR